MVKKLPLKRIKTPAHKQVAPEVRPQESHVK
jgi:hypothetical protein